MIVQDSAVSPGIGLLYLPPYSPNPNLIGRLWKSVKINVYIDNIIRILSYLKVRLRNVCVKLTLNIKKNLIL